MVTSAATMVVCPHFCCHRCSVVIMSRCFVVIALLSIQLIQSCFTLHHLYSFRLPSSVLGKMPTFSSNGASITGRGGNSRPHSSPSVTGGESDGRGGPRGGSDSYLLSNDSSDDEEVGDRDTPTPSNRSTSRIHGLDGHVDEPALSIRPRVSSGRPPVRKDWDFSGLKKLDFGVNKGNIQEKTAQTTDGKGRTNTSKKRAARTRSLSVSDSDRGPPQDKKKRKVTYSSMSARSECSQCGRYITVQNMARHLAGHGVVIKYKTLREWCDPCGRYFAHKQRQRHFARYHGGKELQTKEAAYVWNPMTKRRERVRAPLSRSSRWVSNGIQNTNDPAPPHDDNGEVDDGSEVEDDSEEAGGVSDGEAGDGEGEEEHGWEVEDLARSGTGHFQSSAVDDDDTNPRTRKGEKGRSDTRSSLLLGASRQALELYRERMDTDLELIKKRLDDLSQRCKNEREISVRFRERFGKYHEGLNCWKPAHLITADQYHKMMDKGENVYAGQRLCYVVCSNEEAEGILERGMPLLPLVIPQSGKTAQSVATYLEYLSNCTSVDVHDFGGGDDRDWSGQPEALSGQDAVDRFRADDNTTVNFLNLASVRANPYPACVENSRALSILRELKRAGHVGKAIEFVAADLTNSATFGILGKKDVFSFPHWDHYGLITTIFIEEGVKGWFTWPQMTGVEKLAWAEHASKGQFQFPELDCFMIPLRTGDLLIQPGQTVHAPFTMESTLASGTQLLRSDRMKFHLEAAVLDAGYPNSTNEDAAFEAVDKFEMIGDAWRRGTTAWPWGSEEDRMVYDGLVKELKTRWSVYPFTCRCSNKCRVSRCVCMKNGVACNPGCHKKGAHAGGCLER